MKKVNKYIFPLILIIFGLLAFRHLLLPGYFPMDDNTQVMRLYELETCLKDGQFPCRLVPHLGNGYSFPLFNYYSPLVYYLGVFLRLFKFPYVFIVKNLFLFSVILSGLSFYWLVKRVFKLSSQSALIGSLFYIWAPYRAVDIYVRGDLAESWSFVFLPLIFGILFRLSQVKKLKKKEIFFYNLIISAFLINHLVSLVVVFIPFVLWLLFLFVASRIKKQFLKNLVLLLPSLGLAAFYLLPAVLEKGLVTSETMFSGYFNYLNHFVSLKQLFLSRYWGYGGSNVLDNDTMSFQLGWPMWWLVAVYVIVILVSFFRRKVRRLKVKNLDLISNYPLVVVLLYLISIFLTHAKSYFIWKILSFLSYLQFPWRFLLVAVFFQALIGAFLIERFQKARVIKEIKAIIYLLVVIFILVLNFNYFKPETWWSNFSDVSFRQENYFAKQQEAMIHDYLPKTVKEIPSLHQFRQPKVLVGQANIKDWQLKSNYWQFIAAGQAKTKVLVPVFDYPNWQVVINGKPVPHQVDKKYGLITITLPKSEESLVAGFFINTPVRSLANGISILSLVSLLFLIL